MSLLREIQTDIASTGGDVVSVLRKCKILAARLGSDELSQWVDCELNGYQISQTIPEYRKLNGGCYGDFMNSAWRANHQAIPAFAIAEEHHDTYFAPTEFRDGITTAASFATEGAMIEAPHLPILIRQKRVLFPQMQCARAWREIPPTQFQQLISAVKNRILDFSLKIEAENPSAGEALPNTQPVAREKLQPLVQNTFYGSVGNFSQNSDHFSQTANIGIQSQDLSRLVAEFAVHIDELGLDERQKERAKVQIAALRTELSGEPDPSIVKQAGQTLRNITEGAIGSLLATATQPTVWHWMHQTLVALTKP